MCALDAVVENKYKDDIRDHRVTLLQAGIVPGIASDIQRITRRRMASPSPVLKATTAAFSRVSKMPPTAPPNERPTGKRTAARNDCCVVGQVYALTNMSCDFSTPAVNEEAVLLKGSDNEGRVSTVAWFDAVDGRVASVGRRIDRMLRKCLAYNDLEVHMKKCCRSEKKSEALRKCRRLINVRQRRLCRLEANRKN